MYVFLIAGCDQEDVEIDDHPIDQEEYNVYAGLIEAFDIEGKVRVRSEPLRQSFFRLDSASAVDRGLLNEYPQFSNLFTESYFNTVKDSVFFENRFPQTSNEIATVERSELRDFFNRDGLDLGNCMGLFKETFGSNGYFTLSRVLFDEQKENAMLEVVTFDCVVLSGFYVVLEKDGKSWKEGMIISVYQS